MSSPRPGHGDPLLVTFLAAPVVALALAACGAAPSTEPPTARASTPAPVVACPEEASWLASLPELERSARESLRLPCVPGAGGRWELVLSDLASGPMDEETTGGTGERITGRAAFAFTDAAGRRVVGLERPFELLRAEDWWRSDSVDLRARFDVDGDGLDELFVWVGTHEYEGTPRGEVIVLTARAGAVREHEPARVGVPIAEVRDVDEDGRPDLVSCVPYCGTSPWGASTVPAGGPPNVFRSRPDGTFSSSDPVVLEGLRAACPERPGRFLAARPSEGGYEAAITAVSCARIHGVSSEEIIRTIRAEEAAGTCSDEGWADCAHLVEELVRHAALMPAHRLP